MNGGEYWMILWMNAALYYLRLTTNEQMLTELESKGEDIDPTINEWNNSYLQVVLRA